MKFKVGDKVRVREDLITGNLYGTAYFIGLMEYYRGKVFEVTKVMETSYKLGEDGLLWTDEMLEEVNEEVQEKTFQEVIATIKEREMWVCEKINRKIIKADDGIIEIRGLNDEIFDNVVALLFSDEKYKLQRKAYTFAEAFKAYEEGKVIESCVTGDKYKWNGFADLICKNGIDGYHKLKGIEIEEIKGKWYINN